MRCMHVCIIVCIHIVYAYMYRKGNHADNMILSAACPVFNWRPVLCFIGLCPSLSTERDSDTHTQTHTHVSMQILSCAQALSSGRTGGRKRDRFCLFCQNNAPRDGGKRRLLCVCEHIVYLCLCPSVCITCICTCCGSESSDSTLSSTCNERTHQTMNEG